MKPQTDRLADALKGLDLARDVPLSRLTSFRIGGPCALVFRPHGETELCRALGEAQRLDVPVTVLGNGTNVLAPDAGYTGLLVRFDRPASPPIVGADGTVRAPAATPLSGLCALTLRLGLQGLECLGGIPGTLGGACAMNAGAYGQQLSDTLRRVRCCVRGEVGEAAVGPDDFGYRKSPYAARDCIVLEAELALTADDGGARARARDCERSRNLKQPLSLPSAGSVFKRPEGHYAGALIDRCGLRGARVGGAAVSELHAGFIVNLGGATEADVRALIKLIQDRVRAETGVSLERELKYWSEV